MTQPGEKKPKKKSEAVAFLQVKFKDNESLKAFKTNDLDRGLKSVERLLWVWEGKWEWAVLRMSLSKMIYHYYHPSTGKTRLNRDQFKEKTENNTFSIYVIPTKEWKFRTKNDKGISYKGLKSLDEVKQYDNKDVLKILIYDKKGNLINEYQNGKFKNG